MKGQTLRTRWNRQEQVKVYVLLDSLNSMSAGWLGGSGRSLGGRGEPQAEWTKNDEWLRHETQ